jgi:hypothetical protein
MQTFEDKAGRTWTLELNLAAAYRIDAAKLLCRGRPVLFTEPARWLFDELFKSPGLLSEVIWAAIKPQAAEQQVTHDAWREAMDGPSGLAALQALAVELLDFFQQSPTSLSWLTKALSKPLRGVIEQQGSLPVDQVSPPAERTESDPPGRSGATSTASPDASVVTGGA